MLKTSTGKEVMLKTSTMDLYYRQLMQAESIHADRCVVCGRRYPLNQHHIVPRSAGNLYDEGGHPLPKPTITLCGNGNHLYGSDGRKLCHGRAHSGYLFFRYTDELEYLLTEEPMSRTEAMSVEDGWFPVSNPHWRRIWIG